MSAKAVKLSKGSKVRVIARLRPENSEYTSTATTSKDSSMPSRCVRATGSKSLEVWNWRNGNSLQFQFDGFFGGKSTQEEIYRFSISPVMQYILRGENASVFAYGPTGAGKTHTMLGTPELPGIIPRCICDIFKLIELEESKAPSWKFDVSFSYLEIYQEKVNDLLDKKKQDLPIRQDQQGSIFIPDLTEIVIKNYEEFYKVFQGASQNRTTAATQLNPHSSRSHSILLLKIIRAQQEAPYRKLTGKLYLIDLAGSEDNRRTGNQGVRLKESGAINASLFALGQVVDALNTGQPRIPYRNSKLTRLLQDSLGGSAHTCVIANIAPEPQLYSDTLNTLKFASKSQTIINKPFIQETYDKRIAFKRPCQSTGEDKKPSKIAKTENSEKAPATHIPSGLFSPLRARQESLEERMAALERRLVIKKAENTELQAQKTSSKDETTVSAEKMLSKRKLLSKRKPFKEISNTKGGSHDALVSPKERTKLNPPDQQSEDPVRVDKFFAVKINPTLQAAYDAELLNVLNTGDVKDLRRLHAIGEKRAQLIVQWRQTHSPLKKIQDLAKIEGFTEKMATTFLKKNFLSKMVFT